MLKSRKSKCVTLFLALIMLLTCAPSVSASVSDTESFSTQVLDVEIAAIESAMETRGIGGDIEVDILYDAAGQPAYLLGISAAGYQIISREGLLCLEGGEANPYAGFDDGMKYYGGVLNYYVVADGEFFDIVRETAVSSVKQADYLLNPPENVRNNPRAFEPNASATAAISYTQIIPYEYARIQRKAFGNNNDNTCSAIACTIVLDYLDYDNADIVPSEYHLETLTSNWGADVAINSPRAHAFHRFVVEECGMGAVSYAEGISSAIGAYRESSTAIKNTGIECDWTLNIYTNFGIDELEADRPTMLTSTLAGDYSWHTMPVYGYRRYDDNSLEWLVHTGWYSTLIKENNVYRMPEVWVGASTATYLYRFTYNGM